MLHSPCCMRCAPEHNLSWCSLRTHSQPFAPMSRHMTAVWLLPYVIRKWAAVACPSQATGLGSRKHLRRRMVYAAPMQPFPTWAGLSSELSLSRLLHFGPAQHCKPTGACAHVYSSMFRSSCIGPGSTSCNARQARADTLHQQLWRLVNSCSFALLDKERLMAVCLKP